MSRKRRRVTDEELDQLEKELEDYLRTPVDSWKQEPRWRRFFKLQEQHQEELKKYRTGESSNDKPK